MVKPMEQTKQVEIRLGTIEKIIHLSEPLGNAREAKNVPIESRMVHQQVADGFTLVRPQCFQRLKVHHLRLSRRGGVLQRR